MASRALTMGCILAVGLASCHARIARPGISAPHRLLLQGSAAQVSSNPPNPSEPCYSSPAGPDGYKDMPMYMTATNKCPKDNFYVSFVSFTPHGQNVTYAGGADATPIPGGAQYYWVGPYYMNTSDIHLAILRKFDGKLITPKGVNPDGSFFDISSTSRKVCQLFQQDVNPLRFAIFRAQMSADGLNVVRDDFYNSKLPSSIPAGGVPCEQYVDPAKGGFGAKYGKLVEVFRPGGCRFAIDDCSPAESG